MRLFLPGFVWTLAQIPLGLDAAGFGQYYELRSVAANLAATGEFRDPFGIATGSTAHVAPIYTAILAAAIRIFKQPGAIVGAMILLNACLFGLGAALLPAISRRVYGTPGPGVAGGILLAFSSWLMPQWEAALSSLALMAAALAIMEYGPVVAGVCCGISFLTNPTSLLAIPFVASFRRWRFALLAIGTALLVCAPWILRNWVTLGFPYFIRDNLGLELWISNSDRSSAETVTNWPLFNQHPNGNEEEARLVAALGEGSYNQRRMRDARAWIESHPGRFARLTAARVFYYWFPARREGWPAYLYWTITGLGVLGIWYSRKNGLAMLLAAASILYSLTFAVTATHLRHRFPSLWIWALFAGCGVCRVYLAVQRRRPIAPE